MYFVFFDIIDSLNPPHSGIGWTARELRLTFHCDISRDLAQKACDKMEAVIKSFLE